MNSTWFCLIWGDVLQNKSLFWICTLPVDNLHCLLTACLSLTCQRVTQVTHAHSARWQMVTNANITLNREHNSWQWPQYCWQLVLRLVLGWEFVGSPGLINSLCRCWRQTADTAPRDFGPYQRWQPTLQHHHRPAGFSHWECGLVVQMEEVLCSTRFQYSLFGLRGMLPYLSLVVVVVVVVEVVVDAPLSELGYRGLCRFPIWQTRCWNV